MGEIRGLKSDLCSSRVPGGVQGSILGGFFDDFGTYCVMILVWILGIFEYSDLCV